MFEEFNDEQLKKAWEDNQVRINDVLASLHRLEKRLRELEDLDWDLDEEIDRRKENEKC